MRRASEGQSHWAEGVTTGDSCYRLHEHPSSTDHPFTTPPIRRRSHSSSVVVARLMSRALWSPFGLRPLLQFASPLAVQWWRSESNYSHAVKCFRPLTCPVRLGEWHRITPREPFTSRHSLVHPSSHPPIYPHPKRALTATSLSPAQWE
jgi:hypothetical protein